MNIKQPITPLPFPEFVMLMASMTSLVALSIDAMLPALAEIGTTLGVAQENDSQLIIAMVFLGMALGQILYGPMSDATGRKPAVYLGYSFFVAGSLLSLFAGDFNQMIAGRFLQGFGLAAPRIMTIAVVRDQYSGSAMARVMSFIMMVFILVPMIAPVIGQGILILFNWRGIFAFILLTGVVTALWFIFRQPESLPEERRVPFSMRRLRSAIIEVCTHRVSIGYTVIAGIIFGAFIGYLSSSQQIFQQQYGLGSSFPLYFAMLASAIGFSSFLNGRFVMRTGMQRPTLIALSILTVLSALFFGFSFAIGGHPSLWLVTVYFIAAFSCIGILFGNINAMAMLPLGHIAGIGASVVGSLSTLIAVPVGISISRSYSGTVLPLVGGFAVCAAIALIMMLVIEKGSTAE
ncbi:MAG: multidrug effflux MFS transporter [Gammaproteobacteria bacterium]|nr:multidrug effflux MFS transporter [Gammaproteobacteria bacterium]